MDLDCLGSLILARYLYPDSIALRSGRLHPLAKNLYTLFKHQLDLSHPRDIKGLPIDELVVFDTRNPNLIAEYLPFIGGLPNKITVWDHHSNQPMEFTGATLHSRPIGANTSMIALEVMAQGHIPTPDEATIALSGIYADTGEFSHQTVSPDDFQAAAWLTKCGADIPLIHKLLVKLSESHQMDLFHQVLDRLERQSIQGHEVLSAYIELDGQMPGLAAVAEQVLAVEQGDALLLVFWLKNHQSHLIIGRGDSKHIDLAQLLGYFGGGGHPQAASALVKHSQDIPIYRHLLAYLSSHLNKAIQARDLLHQIQYIDPAWPLVTASIQLENQNLSGAPVVDKEGNLLGILTLRDIQKARKQEQMNAPVSAYMTRKVVSTPEDATIREIEALFYQNSIGHLPVVAGTRVVGMVTRTDYLSFIRGNRQTQSTT
jgi:tRNA nucleotidyltransferase (CCA-adding enzyme)